MQFMPKKIDPELRARAVRLVMEHRGEYPTLSAALLAVSKQVGVGKESLRRWVAQAEVDAGDRPGTTSEENEEIKRLRAENRRLREDVAILKAATTFFVGELDPATGDRRLHRRATRPRARGRVGLSGPARAGPGDRRAHLPGLEAGFASCRISHDDRGAGSRIRRLRLRRVQTVRSLPAEN
jgi:transposase